MNPHFYNSPQQSFPKPVVKECEAQFLLLRSSRRLAGLRLDRLLLQALHVHHGFKADVNQGAFLGGRQVKGAIVGQAQLIHRRIADAQNGANRRVGRH